MNPAGKRYFFSPEIGVWNMGINQSDWPVLRRFQFSCLKRSGSGILKKEKSEGKAG
jgi:hypothetical protein